MCGSLCDVKSGRRDSIEIYKGVAIVREILYVERCHERGGYHVKSLWSDSMEIYEGVAIVRDILYVGCYEWIARKDRHRSGRYGGR